MDTIKKHSLSADERIKSKKDFEQIYSSGRSFFSADRRIKATFIIGQAENPGIKIASAVSRKAGIAVWRNRVKRIIKESYRLNKQILTPSVTEKNISVKIVFSPFLLNEKKNKIIKLKDIMPGIVEILQKIKNSLEK